MKLGDAVVIAKEKLARYLLLPRRKNDKAGYLARAASSFRGVESKRLWNRTSAVSGSPLSKRAFPRSR